MPKMFDASEILQFAIRIEENGEQFYHAMAEKIKDEKIKELFNFLAGEEARHRQIFTEMVSKVENYEPAQSYPGEYFQYLRSYADEHIFTQQNTGSLAAKKIGSAKEAINFALQRELDSILYYLEAKGLVPEAQKGIIDRIIEEERRHYIKLLGLNQA